MVDMNYGCRVEVCGTVTESWWADDSSGHPVKTYRVAVGDGRDGKTFTCRARPGVTYRPEGFSPMKGDRILVKGSLGSAGGSPGIFLDSVGPGRASDACNVSVRGVSDAFSSDELETPWFDKYADVFFDGVFPSDSRLFCKLPGDLAVPSVTACFGGGKPVEFSGELREYRATDIRGNRSVSYGVDVDCRSVGVLDRATGRAYGSVAIPFSRGDGGTSVMQFKVVGGQKDFLGRFPPESFEADQIFRNFAKAGGDLYSCVDKDDGYRRRFYLFDGTRKIGYEVGKDCFDAFRSVRERTDGRSGKEQEGSFLVPDPEFDKAYEEYERGLTSGGLVSGEDRDDSYGY